MDEMLYGKDLFYFFFQKDVCFMSVCLCGSSNFNIMRLLKRDVGFMLLKYQ